MADPLDIIARICHEQPHDALAQIADALGYTEQAAQERAQREQTLAGLAKRLAARLHPEDPLRVTATAYLKEQGFFNPLRNAGVRAVDLPEPDCWAILTPNGSKLVPPGEANGRKDAYRLFSEEQVRELLRAHGVPPSREGQQ